ncbi:transporter substrate-binding domain-containing protein [Synechococcus sp. LA31]|uniref:transporter substrate-binding domain-containing protein n=1 Tax=Synechococcus sp. LA31 TaxID=2741953 RepID=UPI001BDC950D|nr:transporter substrate-binding domain-containing protein [Synechococcus sp. LA31]QVV66655.1 transporter substrate-binding domain-containing protein [Synechococcus sp. LA31]
MKLAFCKARERAQKPRLQARIYDCLTQARFMRMHAWLKRRRGKVLSTLLTCTVTFGATGGSLQAHEQTPEAKQHDTVRAIWFPNPPYAVDEKGVPSGLEIDLWRMIAESHQIPYKIKRASSFASLLAEIRSGEADVGISGILINENRSKQFNFSLPTASSKLKAYALAPTESTALAMLRIVLSREVMLIFMGLTLIACLFAIPVWVLERHRQDLPDPRKSHQLIFILQKTLLLSTDHTKRSTTRLISIGSLFARVLLTAYFTSYVFRLASEEALPVNRQTQPDIQLEDLSRFTFAAIPGSIQSSIAKSNNAKTIDCYWTKTCIAMLQSGKANAILDDEATVLTTLNHMPPIPKVVAASGELMPLLMAFGFSNQFNEDPRSKILNAAISRSYYDGTYSKLQKRWLKE